MATRMDRVEQFLEGKFCFLTMLRESGDGSLPFGKQKTMGGQRQSGLSPGIKGSKLGQNPLGNSFNKAQAGRGGKGQNLRDSKRESSKRTDDADTVLKSNLTGSGQGTISEGPESKRGKYDANFRDSD
jgi:hypothetical protein